MNKKERQAKEQIRKKVFCQLELLFELHNSGWPVDAKLRDCGDLLAPGEKHDYMPEGMNFEELEHFLRLAKRNDVPARVFKDRLRLGKLPVEAATKPYTKKPKKTPSRDRN